MEDFFIKPGDLLEKEFESNKKANRTLAPEDKLPENIVEYIEKLIIENIRNIKFLEKENIPESIKTYRLEFLNNQQQVLLDKLSRLKNGEEQ